MSVDKYADNGSPDDVLEMSNVSEHEGSVPPQSQSELSPDRSCTCAPSADTQSAHTHSTHSALLDDAYSAGPPSVRSDSSTIHRVRTRVGCIMKPVVYYIRCPNKESLVMPVSSLAKSLSQCSKCLASNWFSNVVQFQWIFVFLRDVELSLLHRD